MGSAAINGSRSHQSQSCPDKSIGSRCFNCNKFGHIAKECKEKKSDFVTANNQAKPVRTVAVVPKAEDAHIYVQCGENVLLSLVDSGSHAKLMRKTVFEKLKHKADMKKSREPFKGFGNVITRSLGSFDCLFDISDDTYDVECWIVKDEDITDDVIIGLDIINQAEFSMKRGKVTLKKLVEEDEADEKFINKIKTINCVVKSNEPDLSNIKEEKSRETITHRKALKSQVYN